MIYLIYFVLKHSILLVCCQNLVSQCEDLDIPFVDDMPSRCANVLHLVRSPCHVDVLFLSLSDSLSASFDLVIDAVFGFRCVAKRILKTFPHRSARLVNHYHGVYFVFIAVSLVKSGHHLTLC